MQIFISKKYFANEYLFLNEVERNAVLINLKNAEGKKVLPTYFEIWYGTRIALCRC